MAYIITTTSPGGRRWYLLKRGGATLDRDRARRFPSRFAANIALVKICVDSKVDSVWHHAHVISDDGNLCEPES